MAILSTAAPINRGASLLGFAAAHGLAASIVVNNFGDNSKARINPAVTAGMPTTGRISPPLAGGYLVAQRLGATAAAYLCKAIFPAAAVSAANLGIPLLGAEGVTTSFILPAQIVLTFLLVTSMFGTAIDERGQAVKIGGFGIGLMFTLAILACGPTTGASMNPARSFGPAPVQDDFQPHWCYWLAPIVGGVAAALLYHHVILNRDVDLA